MSFWNDIKDDNDGSFEMGGSIEPMPDGTSVLAAPYEASWDEYQGDSYISINWTVLAPDEYKNRKVFQKVRVNDSNGKKADKAKRMLAAIDSNAGGKLVQSGEEPTDESLTRCLVNRPMVLRLGLWQLTTETGEEKTGNWVQAVSPKQGGTPTTKPAAAKQEEDDFDDTPF